MGNRDQNERASRKVRERALAIYGWAFNNQSITCFTASMVPGYVKGKTEQMAFEMLTVRGLLRRTKTGASVPWWTLNRAVNPAQCLAITAECPIALRGVTSYRVPVGIAESMGDAPNLRQYAIGGRVKTW